MAELSRLKAEIEDEMRDISQMYDYTEDALKKHSGPGIEAVNTVLPMMRDHLKLMEMVMKYIDLRAASQGEPLARDNG